MKKLVLFTMCSILLAAVAPAVTSQKLVEEMEDYLRDLIRAHPEVIGDKKRKEAAKDMLNSAGQERVFEVSEEEEKSIRRRKDLVSEGQFNSALKQIKSLNSKDPKITFLIKYAEQKKIKSIEKLLAYRLMRREHTKAADKMAFERDNRISTILKKYMDYKAANSKPPASLADLDLPENCKQFVNSKGEKLDWIYIGHLGPRLKNENSHVVLAEPEPFGDARICGMDNGQIKRFQNASIEGHLNKLTEAMKNGTIKPGGAAGGVGTPPPALAAIMKKILLYKDLNNENLPESLNDLEIDEAHKNYTDPSTGEKSPWVYLGKKSKFKVKDDVKIIILAPKAQKGRRLAGLSNGKVVSLDDKKIAPHIK